MSLIKVYIIKDCHYYDALLIFDDDHDVLLNEILDLENNVAIYDEIKRAATNKIVSHKFVVQRESGSGPKKATERQQLYP